jgi:hypothetical protein
MADFVRNPKLAEQLHCVRVVDVAFGVPAGLRIGVEDRRFDTVRVEVQRQRKPDRAPADYCNGRISRHGYSLKGKR